MSALPDNWDVPAWNAKAPVPCTKVMLIAWLAKHHGVALSDEAGMGIITRIVNTRYAPAECPATAGPFPATWDVWAFVVEQEKRIRGGQLPLLEAAS
jgi:hypothetical protein